VSITRNYLSDSAQEIFIQPMFGPIDDVLVENNLLAGARDYAVQSQAVTGLSFVNNTVWDSHYGMAIRHGPNGEPPATDGVVVGNIIDRLGYPAGTLEEYNLIGEPTRPAGYGSHDLLSADPTFIGGGDYSLQAESPAADAGSPQIFPSHDLPGIARSSPPSMGAYEIASESDPTDSEKPTGSGPSPPTEKGSRKGAARKDDGAAKDHAGSSERSLKIALRIPGHGTVAVRRDIDLPEACSEDCHIIVTGSVTIFGGSKPAARQSMRLRSARVRLSQMVRHGMRLATDSPGALDRDKIGGPIHALARLDLRYAPGSPDEVRQSMLVRFGWGR
jgi:hypothetical protein